MFSIIIYLFYKNIIITFCEAELITRDFSSYEKDFRKIVLNELKNIFENEEFQEKYLGNFNVWIFSKCNFVDNFVEYLFRNNKIDYSKNLDEILYDIHNLFINRIIYIGQNFSFFMLFYSISITQSIYYLYKFPQSNLFKYLRSRFYYYLKKYGDNSKHLKNEPDTNSREFSWRSILKEIIISFVFHYIFCYFFPTIFIPISKEETVMSKKKDNTFNEVLIKFLEDLDKKHK